MAYRPLARQLLSFCVVMKSVSYWHPQHSRLTMRKMTMARNKFLALFLLFLLTGGFELWLLYLLVTAPTLGHAVAIPIAGVNALVARELLKEIKGWGGSIPPTSRGS
jgi:hypothetical protein